MIAAPAVCFGYEHKGDRCPTPTEVVYVSRCEQIACAACLEEALAYARAHMIFACLGCDALIRTEADVRAHWRPIAGAA